MLKAYVRGDPSKLLLGLNFSETELLRQPQSLLWRFIGIKAVEWGQSLDVFLVSGRNRHEIRSMFAANGVRPGLVPMGERPIWHAKSQGRVIVALTLSELAVLQAAPCKHQFVVVGRYIHIDFDVVIFSGDTDAAMKSYANSLVLQAQPPKLG